MSIFDQLFAWLFEWIFTTLFANGFDLSVFFPVAS